MTRSSSAQWAHPSALPTSRPGSSNEVFFSGCASSSIYM